MELFAVYLTREERDALRVLAKGSAKFNAQNRTGPVVARIAEKVEAATQEETHNGWANIETWTVNLYLTGNYDGQATAEQARECAQDAVAQIRFAQYAGETDNAYAERIGRTRDRVAGEAAAQFMRNLADTAGVSEGVLCDLTSAALARVNWPEIGSHLLED
jgi:hypothetical protein